MSAIELLAGRSVWKPIGDRSVAPAAVALAALALWLSVVPGVAPSFEAGSGAPDVRSPLPEDMAGTRSTTLARAPDGLQSAVHRTLEQEAYRFIPDTGGPAGAFRADNAANGFTARFSRSGTEVIAAGGRDWTFGLRLQSYGYPGGPVSVGEVHPRVSGDRVSYRHGPLTEWYLNGPEGLEQGFTLSASPPGRVTGDLLLVTLGLSGSLSPALDHRTITLSTDAGIAVASYAKLRVEDASGRVLPSELRLREGAIVLAVREAGARYPITIDPLVAGEDQKLLASDGAADDGFGFSVAMSGNTAVVGTPNDDTVAGENAAGSAYVFVRSGSTWTEQQKLTALDGAAGDNFGRSVALSGNTVVVGAPHDDTAAGFDAGSAYVFVRSGTTWTRQQKLRASGGALDDVFGWSVALSGDTAVVGVPLDDRDPEEDVGSAYVFVRSGTTWTKQQKLTSASFGVLGGVSFGGDVALSGNTAVVGAGGDDDYAGSAYVFVRSGTTWSPQRRLTASDGADYDAFGVSVALSGNNVVVGAPHDDTAAGFDAGSAYVFVRSGTTWTEQQKLVSSNGAQSARFGFSVALSGDTAVVGAPYGDPSSAYVFVRSGTTWTEQQELPEGDAFGWSVALSGSTAVVGAPSDDTTAGTDAGSAYVYRIPFKLLADDGTASDHFGRSVALSGDTALVGAEGGDPGAAVGGGSAYVFVRSGNTWRRQQKLTAADGAAGDLFGNTVALSGDTAVVGAPLDDTRGGTDAGSAYVFVRSGTTWTMQQKVLAPDGAAGDHFGTPVALSGDTAVVGAFFDDTLGGTDAGSAYVFLRSGTTWRRQQKLTAPDGASGDLFGNAVAVRGDTAVVGAWYDDTPAGTDAGSAYVFLRSGTTWTRQRLLAPDGAAGDNFGVSVALGGGTAVVGAFLDDTSAGTDAGSAYVFLRSGTTWKREQRLTASDGAAGDNFGVSVALGGGTAVVGAFLDDTPGGTDAGSASVFARSGTTWSFQQRLLAPDGAAGDNFGVSVVLGGGTAVVGAFLDDTSAGTDAGSAYIHDPE